MCIRDRGVPDVLQVLPPAGVRELVEDDDLVARPKLAGQGAAATAAVDAPSSGVSAPAMRALRSIDFRRGADGTGRLIVKLTDPRTPINVRQQGDQIVVDFAGADVPKSLIRRYDASDFATPVTGFDVVKVGVNYRFGGGSGPLSANAADPALFKSVPMLASGWSLEVGSRFFISSNRMQKDLYDPVQTDRLNSRLIYADQTGQSLETFFRFDHQTGVFAKGTFGIGNMSGGKLNDEDFPVNVYSNTVSDMKNGRLMNGSADIGYNVINQPGGKLGAYVGYRSFYLRGNGYGCAQIATDGTCAPTMPWPP